MAIFRYPNLDGLLNCGVSDFLMKDSELYLCKNVWSHQIGKIEKVPGYTAVYCGSSTFQADKLHWFYDSTNNKNYLISIKGATNALVYYISYDTTPAVSTWTAVSGATSWASGSKTSCVNYLSKTFMVSYTEELFVPTFKVPATIEIVTGTPTLNYTSAADSDLLNMPAGKQIVRYRDLIYVLNAYIGTTRYPNRAYYCSEPTAGAITWTVATDFIEVGYDDADEIVGGIELLDKLYIFKKNSIWRYDESVLEKISDIGCSSAESIQKINNVIYWVNERGVWGFAGNSPELISEKAKRYFDNYLTRNGDFTSAWSTIYNNHEYRLYLGVVSVDGITFQYTWFCWDTLRNKAYIRCTYDSVATATPFRVSANKNKIRTVFHTGSKSYYFNNKEDEVYSDGGNNIHSMFITKAFDHGIPELEKYTTKMTVFSQNCQGMKIAMDSDNKKEFNEERTQVLEKNVDEVEFSTSGNRTRFMFSENGQGKSWEMEGFTMEVNTGE